MSLNTIFFKNLKQQSVLNLITRQYSRWSHRRPLKVYSSNSESSTVNIEDELPSENRKIRIPRSKLNIKDTDQLTQSAKKLKVIKDQPVSIANISELGLFNEEKNINSDIYRVKDENGKFTFEKMKRNDRKLSTLMMDVKFRKQRERFNTVLLEGTRLIRDALLANCKPRTILFSRMSELKSIEDLLPKENITLYQVPYNDLQLWSSLKTSPGIMGIFETPNVSNIKTEFNDLPVTVVCDNIRDPGNLGAVIRCSAAVGCKKMLLTKGCVELWDLKVLRSASGAHFRISIEQKQSWSDIQSEIDEDSSIFIADNNLNIYPSLVSTTYNDFQYYNCPEITLIVGGETQGVSNEAYLLAEKKSGTRLHIPLSNGIESLNIGTALAVILYEMRRQISPITLRNNQSNTNKQISNLQT